MAKNKMAKAKRKLDLNGIIAIIFFICLAFAVMYLIDFGVGHLNTITFCKSIGYSFYEIVGDEHFNCCRYDVRNVLYYNYTIFEEKIECVAGGIYPAK